MAEMIFGKPVTQPTADTISVGDREFTIFTVPAADAKIDEERSRGDFTLWEITVRHPTRLQPDTEAYIRLRFRLSRVKRIWRWKRLFLRAHGALIDVRFSDVREALNVKDGEVLQDWILPVGTLNFFVVAPSSFHVVATSPSLYYTRVLEGRPWERYLKQRTSLWGERKLTIHEWRRNNVTVQNPMRVYLDLGTDPRDISGFEWVLGIAIFFLLVSYAASLSAWIPTAVGGLLAPGVALVAAHPWRTLFSVLAAISGTIVWHMELIYKRLLQLRKWVYNIERWLYSPRT